MMPVTTRPHSPRRVGLTGGIGSGKSEVAHVLKQLGAVIVDADQIARTQTQAGGAAIAPIRASFGPHFIDEHGALNRQRMRTLVFNNPDARRRLEALTHPLIRSAIHAQVHAAPLDRTVVIDMPLLQASDRDELQLSRILVIDCSAATQIQRVMHRSAWPRELVEQVIAQQASREQRQALADDLIVNEGVDLEGLRQRVETVWHNWFIQV